MPANKNKLLRLQTILAMMRKSAYPNFNRFMVEMKRQDPAGAYKLSGKTFSRDIADLKEEFHAPIRYDAARKGFFLANLEWYSEELMIEPFEMRSVLLGQRVAEGLMPEPLRSEITRAVDSLLMRNESGLEYGASLEALQIFNGAARPIEPEAFLTVYRAWEGRRHLRFEYLAANGRSSRKFFDPHLLAWQGGAWYMKGELYSSDDKVYDPPKISVLAVHRVRNPEIAEGFFVQNPALYLEAEKHGFFTFARYERVEVEFYPPYDRIMTEFFPDRLESVEPGEGKAVIRFRDLYPHEAISLILYAQGYARVIAPEELKTKIREIGQRMVDNGQ